MHAHFRNRGFAPVVLAIALALITIPAWAWPAKVDHVSDGDTVTVINQIDHKTYRVRLQGIDTPETNHGSGQPGQPYGEAAKRTLQKLLANADVAVQPSGAHSYDRIVGRVTANGVDVANNLVLWGMAWDYPNYDREHRYVKYERAAKLANRGLWAQGNPIAPWNWRHNHWSH